MGTIQRSTLVEKILEALVEMVKTQNYRVNDLLPTEKELSEMLGVSRNSVREALKTLNMAGITESVSGRGTFLRVDPTELRGGAAVILDAVNGVSLMELLQVRRIIETEGAALAAQRAKEDPRRLKELEKKWKALMKALDSRQREGGKAGNEFHMAVVELGGNRLLVKLLYSIMGDVRSARRMVPLDLEHFDREEDVHTRIFRAIERGDSQGARQAMEDHFANTEVYYRIRNQQLEKASLEAAEKDAE
jgi:GntR family transcriptional repressor for pyruvate dehydrogenase complex